MERLNTELAENDIAEVIERYNPDLPEDVKELLIEELTTIMLDGMDELYVSIKEALAKLPVMVSSNHSLS